MKKRFFTSLFVIVLCLSIVACSSDNESSKNGRRERNNSEKEEQEETKTEISDDDKTVTDKTDMAKNDEADNADDTGKSSIDVTSTPEPQPVEVVDEGFTGQIGDFEIEKGVLMKYRGTDELVVIPDCVTEIGMYALYRCDKMKTVVIPDSVTKINSSAFQECSSLTSVSIPDSVISIRGSAFCDCRNLTSVELPDNIKTIDTDMFLYCTNLTDIRIPSGVTEIKYCAFYGCTALSDIDLPDNLISIEYEAFSGCKKLSNIDIPKSVTNIGDCAFEKTPWLEAKLAENEYVIVNNILIKAKDMENAVIPDGVVAISGAFVGCERLKSVVIPNSVKLIGNRSFSGCKRLNEINIPNSVTSIGEDIYDAQGAFANCDLLTNIKIPDSVTYIGDKTFFHCSRLSNIEIPASVSNFGKNVFYECTILNVLAEEDSFAALYCEQNGINYTTYKSEKSEKSEEEIITGHDGNYIVFGHYEQNGYTGDGPEPIEWIVLAEKGDKIFIISRYVLDGCTFNDENEATTWDKCSLRKWLNDDFLNTAFNEDEQKMIQTTKLKNYSNIKTNTDGGKNTKDKVFCLSVDEVQKYFQLDNWSDESMSGSGKSLFSDITPYAASHKVSSYKNIEDLKDSGYLDYYEGEHCGSWWLRNPGYNGYYACYVFCGSFGWDYDANMNELGTGVRPAMWIEKNDTITKTTGLFEKEITFKYDVDEKLYGTWSYDKNNRTYFYTFEKNNLMLYERKKDGVTDKETYKYSANGEVLWMIEGDDEPKFYFYKIEGNTLTLNDKYYKKSIVLTNN
jgi:hypothetical protein